MRRLLVALLLGVATLTAGCGSTSTGPQSGDATGTKVIDVTFDGNSVSPSGDRVQVAVGQPVELDIHADASGEIHVHSDPEQHVEYHAGTTQAPIGSFDIPGQITIESHALDKVIVVLQVS